MQSKYVRTKPIDACITLLYPPIKPSGLGLKSSCSIFMLELNTQSLVDSHNISEVIGGQDGVLPGEQTLLVHHKPHQLMAQASAGGSRHQHIPINR